MAKGKGKPGKLPGRTSTAGSGNKSKTPVGRGVKGHPFYNVKKFNAAVSMAKKAGRPGPTPVGQRPQPAGKGHMSGGNQQTAHGHIPIPHNPSQAAHYATAEVSKPTPAAKTVAKPKGLTMKSIGRM